jgi:hypothetical protein
MIVRELLAQMGFKVDTKGIDDWEKRIERNKKLMEQMKSASTAVGSVLAGVVKAGVVGFAGLAVAAAKVGGEFESLRASLKTVTGSSEAAAKAFATIRTFAAQTPYSVKELTAGFIKLKALGLDPSERALKSYGNTASAMGKTFNDMIEAVADASTGEFERLKEFGIKASSQGDQVSFTFQGVTTTVKKNANEIQEYLLKIGETNFAGAMDLQSKTLNGAFSNLGDAVEGFLDTVAHSGLGEALGEIARDMAGMASSSGGLAKTLGQALAKAVRELWSRFKQFIPTIPVIVRQFGDLAGAALKIADVALKIIDALGGPGRLIPTLLVLKGSLAATTLAMDGIGFASKAAAGGVTALGGAFGALALAIGGALLILNHFEQKADEVRREGSETTKQWNDAQRDNTRKAIEGMTDAELEQYLGRSTGETRQQIQDEQFRRQGVSREQVAKSLLTGDTSEIDAAKALKADTYAGFVEGLGDEPRDRAATERAAKARRSTAIARLNALARRKRSGKKLKPSEAKELASLQKELDITPNTAKGKASKTEFDRAGYERALDAYKSIGIAAPHNLRAAYTDKKDKKKHLEADELLAKDFGGGVTARGKIVDSARAQLGTTINRIDNSYAPKVDVHVSATQAAGEDGGTFAQRVADIAKAQIERTVLRPGYDHFLGAVTG